MTFRSMTVGAAAAVALLACMVDGAPAAGPRVLLKNEIPYGEREGALMAQGSRISALLCVESQAQQDVRVGLSLRVPHPLKVSTDDRRIGVSEEADDQVVAADFPLRIEGEKWFSSVTITIPEDAPPGEYAVRSSARARGGDGEETVEQVARLRVVSRGDIVKLFHFGEPTLPSNEKGAPEDRQERGTVLIKGKKTFWQGLVEDRKQSSRFDTKPSTYLSVPIRNTSPHKAIVLVRMDVVDPVSGERIPGFELPYAAEHGDTLGEVAVYQVVEMNPESAERVVLPVYVSETVRPGMVTARVRAVLFGTDIEADRKDLAVKVVGVRWLPALMTAVALLTGLGGLATSYWQRKRYLEMKGRDLILIALFGTVMFAVVSIPGTLLLHAAHIILGPFSFLVTGFFHEILFYLLLVSLVVLIPRVGTVSLAVAVRFLLSSFVLGELSPISLIYYATTATCLEAAVYCSGLSRAKRNLLPHPGALGNAPDSSGEPNRSPDPVDDDRAVAAPSGYSRSQILLAAIVLGITDAFLSFVFFNLSMFFYRLYYATWYLAAYLFIDSFCFTLIAVPFGFKLGSRLKVTANV